jgi:hypothetical protein
MDDIIQRCHEILHLPEKTTREEVREAYNKIVHSGHLQKEEWEKTKEIDWAYETLMRSFLETEEHDRQDASPALQETPYVIDDSLVTRLKNLIFSVEEKKIPFISAAGLLSFSASLSGDWYLFLNPSRVTMPGNPSYTLLTCRSMKPGIFSFHLLAVFCMSWGEVSSRSSSLLFVS